ncbi:alpha/beta fold hydrolase [Haloarcula laminariae]|uniref:alpha/beta fold hydrolase n=1 Tax=Haloarcula laminariae TaxID=2961577 RepID=UPI00240624EE|nr:alpha/beta hydrolase [Halomicroarcula sp. FL173]
MNRPESETLRRGVDATGPADATTLVLVHGAVFQRRMWAPQRDTLAEQFRVVTVDLPGHGERAGTDFDLGSSVELLEGVFDEVGPAILVGLSLGGYVATAYAYDSPEAVDGLVLTGSSANPVGVLDPLTRAVAGLTRLLTRSDRVESKLEDFAAWWTNRRDITADHKREIIDAGFSPRQFGVAGPYLAGQDFRAAFGRYDGPALVLNGQGDLVSRLGAGDHGEAAPDARVEVVDGSGHTANLGRPEAYTEAIRRFTRRVRSDTSPGVEQQ